MTAAPSRAEIIGRLTADVVLSLRLQPLVELLLAPGIDALILCQPPALPRHDPEADVLIIIRTMHIAIDRDFATGLDGRTNMGVTQIQAHPMRVDLQCYIMFERRREDLIPVGFQSGPTLDQSPCWVTDDVHHRMLYGFEQTLRRLLGLGAQPRVGRGDDHIKLGEKIIVIIERAIDQDVHLAAGHDRDALDLLIRLADRLDVLMQTLGREPASDG